MTNRLAARNCGAAAAYTIAHLRLPEGSRGRIRQTFYQAGHMMYIRPADHAKLHQDVAELIKAAGRP